MRTTEFIKAGPTPRSQGDLRHIGDLVLREGEKYCLVLCLWFDKDLNVVITGEGHRAVDKASCHDEKPTIFEPSPLWKSRIKEALKNEHGQ